METNNKISPKRVHTRLTEEQHKAVKKITDDKGITISSFIRELVEKAVKKNLTTPKPHKRIKSDKSTVKKNKRGLNKFRKFK